MPLHTLANVLLSDGVDLNQELVKQGWYWWNQKYAPGNTVLEGLERNAREGQEVLWAHQAPAGASIC